MATTVELYEALKGHVGPDAARLVAESIPMTSELATKSDLALLGAEIKAEIAEIRGEIKGVETRLMRWMLTYFVPLWLGVYGTLAAAVLGLIWAR